MSSVKSLVSEYSVNREVFHGFEFGLLSKCVKHLRTDGGGVSSEEILLSLVNVPVVLVAEGTEATFLVDIFNFLPELLRELLAVDGVLEEKGVVHISRRVALRLEKSIEVPEGALYVPIGGHFIETHLQKNLSEVSSYLQERVQMASVSQKSIGVKVKLLELGVFPRTGPNHLSSQVGI